MATHLVLLLVSVTAVQPDLKSLVLRRFKSYRDEIRLQCSSSKIALIDGVEFWIWRHRSGRKVLPPGEWSWTRSVCRAPISVRQFLIYSTFVRLKFDSSCFTCTCIVARWRSGKVSALWLRGRWFESHQDRFRVITLSKLFTLMVLRPTQPSIPPG